VFAPSHACVHPLSDRQRGHTFRRCRENLTLCRVVVPRSWFLAFLSRRVFGRTTLLRCRPISVSAELLHAGYYHDEATHVMVTLMNRQKFKARIVAYQRFLPA